MSTTTGTALKGRDRARAKKLEEARERRVRLDPERRAREERIDEASVDCLDAWSERGAAIARVEAAELEAAEAIERLMAEGLGAIEVGGLVDLDQATVRRLRRARSQRAADAGGQTAGA